MCCMCSTNLYVDENVDVIDERIFVFRRTFSEGWRCDVHIRRETARVLSTPVAYVTVVAEGWRT